MQYSIVGSQVGAAVIIFASHHCDPGSILGSYVGCDWLISIWLPGIFLWVLRFSSLRKNQLSRQNLCRRAYWSRVSGSGDCVTTPNAAMLNKQFAFFLTKCFVDNADVAVNHNLPISYPEPSNFLQRMLDENEGSGKNRFLGDPDWFSEMQYNTIQYVRYLRTFGTSPFQSPSSSSNMRRKKLEGSGYEIDNLPMWLSFRTNVRMLGGFSFQQSRASVLTHPFFLRRAPTDVRTVLQVTQVIHEFLVYSSTTVNPAVKPAIHAAITPNVFRSKVEGISVARWDRISCHYYYYYYYYKSPRKDLTIDGRLL